MRYQVIFCQGDYTCVDDEVSTMDQALERKAELTSEMRVCGERDFYYIIKEVK